MDWLFHESDEDNFRRICTKKIDNIRNEIHGRKIVIWGGKIWKNRGIETVELKKRF